MRNENEEKEMINMVYRPPNQSPEPLAQKSTLGVKFSNDVFLLRSFLDQRKIEYKEEELDDSPFGKGIRIKRE